MEPESTVQVRLSVRQLVEFLRNTGSIDNRFTGFDRALEGARIHRRLQKAAGLRLPEGFLHRRAVMHGGFLRLQQGGMPPPHHLQQGAFGLARREPPLRQQRIGRRADQKRQPPACMAAFLQPLHQKRADHRAEREQRL